MSTLVGPLRTRDIFYREDGQTVSGLKQGTHVYVGPEVTNWLGTRFRYDGQTYRVLDVRRRIAVLELEVEAIDAH